MNKEELEALHVELVGLRIQLKKQYDESIKRAESLSNKVHDLLIAKDKEDYAERIKLELL
jgi:hypothetical protein